MKVVMINDCAFVAETLLKYMPPDINKQSIKRTRGFWSKTFGLAYAILKTQGDLYHVHYLLQDCYLATRLGKRPLIGHAHGSDLRSTLNHPLLGIIVRKNLRNCDKILVSTPDILSIAKQFRSDAEYLPNPVDPKLFYPKPPVPHNGKKRVLIASNSDWRTKGTDIALRALAEIKDEVEVSIIGYGVDFGRTIALASSLGLCLNVWPRVSHKKLNQYYWSADVVVDRFKLGSLGMISLEAIACGRPVVTYVSSTYSNYKGFPLKDLCEEDKIVDAINDATPKLWEKEYAYLMKNHDRNVIISELLKIYQEHIEETPKCHLQMT
jgi:glycosyltransferase involved in cell wall biosynthesis